MSAEYPKISIMAAYNQALEEGYTPRQAKNILYNNIHFFNERTIRRYLPLEAKDTAKIRTKPTTADNGPQKSTEKDQFSSNQGGDHGEVIGTSNREENVALDSSSKSILSFSMTIMKLAPFFVMTN